MSTVVMNSVVSLDGFVAGPDDDPGPLTSRHLFDLTNGWEGDPHVVIHGDRVLHLRFRVRRA